MSRATSAAISCLLSRGSSAAPTSRPGRRRCPASRPPRGRGRRSRRPRRPGRSTVRRGGRHHRPEVAGGLAVDEVAHPVRRGARRSARRRRGSGTRARRSRPSISRVSLPSASGVPTPVGQKNAPMPAPAARIRSARLPCGTSSSSISPGAVEAVEDPRVGLPRERADHLAHPALREQRGQAGVAVAGVVGDHGQVGRALLGSARRSAATGIPAMPKPPISTVEPSSMPATASSPIGADRWRSRHVLEHDGERLADADADRGDAPPLAATPAAGGRGCRGSGRRRRRAGGRSRSRRPWR